MHSISKSSSWFVSCSRFTNRYLVIFTIVLNSVHRAEAECGLFVKKLTSPKLCLLLSRAKCVSLPRYSLEVEFFSDAAAENIESYEGADPLPLVLFSFPALRGLE